MQTIVRIVNEKERKNLPRIYLDTNKWIEFAQIIKGKKLENEVKEICTELLELSKSDKILIPFSSFNFFEIIKGNNQQQREEMIDFMVVTSKGWFFKPIDKYLKFEIKNACFKKLNSTKYYDVFSQIISNRADSILNGSIGKILPRENQKPTKEKQQEVQKIWDDSVKDPEMMKKMLKQKELNLFAKEDIRFIDQISKKIESDRNNSYGVSDSIFDKYTRVKYIIEYLKEPLTKFCYENKIPIKSLFENKSEFEALVENMPALNVYAELNYIRDKESKERKVERNDYYDIWHFATGLSYANVMIGEKMFSNISKRQRLDKKNNCFLFTSFNELSKYNIRDIIFEENS